MSESPGLDHGHVVPLIDLDDHRAFLNPRAGSISRSRRGTFGSLEDAPRANSDLNAGDGSVGHGTFARDFECAIADDSASVTSHHQPVLQHRGTIRKNRLDSSKSRNHSPSPPTSVHAFAEHRRQRGNTINEQDNAGSADGLPRRRLTFTDNRDGKTNDSASSISTNTEAEQDVCYPQDDHPEDGPEIDFEELEEYVAEVEQTAPATPAVPVQEGATEVKPVTLPSPIILPSDDAFDELEKVKGIDAATEVRSSQVEVAKPFYTYFASENDDTVHATSLGGLLNEGETFKQLFTATDNGCWWLDVVRPTEEEVSVLCKAFSVHPLTREDITTQESREKVEMFNHYYFVAFRSFEDDKTKEDEYLEPIHIYAVVFRYGILTFSYQSTPHASNVLKRVARLRDYLVITTDWVAYALIDDIVDGFMPVINEVDKEVDTIEDQVYIAREEDARNVLAHIGECRKKVMTLLRLLGGKSDVIKGFAKRCNPHYSIAPTSDVGMYLSDIQDHIVTMRDNLSHSEQLLSRIHTNFLAQVNIDNINSGNKTNRMLGKVTLIATILVPMNLITGLFGMNVQVPWKDVNSNTPWLSILGFIFAFSILCVIVFRRLRLI